MVAVFLVLVVCSAAFSSANEHFSVDNNTIALWRFNEGAGDSIFDASGNKNHGKFNKTPTLSTVSGVKGSGVFFDGSLFAKVANDGVFNLTGSFSFEARIQIPTGSEVYNFRLLSCHQYGKNNTGYIWGQGGALFEGYNLSGQKKAETYKMDLNLNIWYVVGFHYDSATTKAKFSLNGAFVDSALIDLNKISYTPMPLLIGAELHPDSVGGAGFFQGIIDEIKISRFRPTQPPAFESSPDTISLESHLYTYLVKVRDPDSSNVVLSLTTFPAGMALRGDTVFFTPSVSQVGAHQIVIRAVDAQGDVSTQQYTLNVLSRSGQIIISNVSPSTDTVYLSEGDSTVFSLSARSRNPSLDITHQWYKNQAIVAVDTFYKLKTNFRSAGICSVIVVLYDGVEFSEKKWIVKVQNVALRPVLISPTSDNSATGDSLFKWSCDDPDLNPATTRYEIQFMRNSQPYVPIFTLYALQASQFVLKTLVQKADLPEGVILNWRVRAYDADGDTVPFSANSVFFYIGYSIAVEKMCLSAGSRFFVSPNPFNPETRITFSSNKSLSNVLFQISDISGRIVKSFPIVKKGHTIAIDWNGADNNNNKCPTGLYICSVVAGDFRQSLRIMLTK